MFKKRVVGMAMAMAAMGALLASPALAVTITDNLSVTANVPGACAVSTTAVGFGAYSGAQLDATGTVTVNCTLDLAYSVELAGGGVGGGAVPREMPKVGDPTQTLPYELYKDLGRSQVWGGAAYTAGSATAMTGLAGTGADNVINVYGRIPAAQPLSAGNFADTVVVSVIY